MSMRPSKAAALTLLVLLGVAVGVQAQAAVGVGSTSTGAGAMAGATAGVAPGATSTSTFATGPKNPLDIDFDAGATYGDITAKVGDTINFRWKNAPRGVYELSTADCPTTFKDGVNGQREIAPSSPSGTAKYVFNAAGTYYFTSPVGNDCEQGKKIKVVVTK